MNRIPRCFALAVLLAVPLSMLCCGAAKAQTTYIYDFDSLEASPNPGTQLDGQDNWVILGAEDRFIYVRNDSLGPDIDSWPGFTSQCASRGKSSIAFLGRSNNLDWAYTLTGSQLRMEINARATGVANSFLQLGIWSDDNDDNDMDLPDDITEHGLQFGLNGEDVPVIVQAAGGTKFYGTMPGGADMDSADVWRYVLDVDLAANSGDGSGSLSMQYLGDVDGSFDFGKSLTLDPVPDLQNINMNLLAMAAPSNWDGTIFRLVHSKIATRFCRSIS